MKDIVTLPDDGLKFKDYQREILSRSLCGFFLPVTFLTSVREGKPVVRACSADRTGYTPLEARERIGGKLCHLLLTGILTGIREAANCYLFPGDYRLTAGTVCFSEREERVRCLFLPSGRDRTYPAVDLAEEAGIALDGLREELSGRCDPEAAEDLRKIASLLRSRRGGIDTALLSVARMKRRAGEERVDLKRDFV